MTTLTPHERLAHAGALLVHPRTAYILSHIEPIDAPVTTYIYPETDDKDYSLYSRYINQVTEAARTLFGAVDFEFLGIRQYGEAGLPPHKDLDVYDEDVVLRMATLIHNLSEETRYLHFQRPTGWTRLPEEFKLEIPPGKILAMGDELITDYEHYIPEGEAVGCISIVNRFSLRRDLDDFDE